MQQITKTIRNFYPLSPPQMIFTQECNRENLNHFPKDS